MRQYDYVEAVIGSTKLSWKAQAVLWMLARHVNSDTADTFVGLPTLARKLQRPLSVVREGFAELRDAGAITVDYRAGRSSVTRFAHPAISTTPPKTQRGNPAGKPATPRRVSAQTPPGTRRHNSSNSLLNPRADDGDMPDWFVAKVGHRMAQ
jgi:hypothetical protein